MLYFAYGSNMDPEGMRARAPRARALGAARLAGWRLTFSADAPDAGFGVPHIEPDENDEVWGVLWDATEDDLRALDDYEGVGLGAYTRDVVVISYDGRDVEAIVYLSLSRSYQRPARDFVEILVRGAEAHGVPRRYVEKLRGLA
jgi:gamma-glutamylcyclotransferase (GGCT)/AIG2-like uncharacterized protein YtfP